MIVSVTIEKKTDVKILQKSFFSNSKYIDLFQPKKHETLYCVTKPFCWRSAVVSTPCERPFVDITRSNLEVTHRTVSHKDMRGKLQGTVGREARDSMYTVNVTEATRHSFTIALSPLRDTARFWPVVIEPRTNYRFQHAKLLKFKRVTGLKTSDSIVDPARQSACAKLCEREL